MYRVIKSFADLKDAKWLYRVGDVFPRAGAKADEARTAELASSNNALKEPLIKEVSEYGNDGTVSGTEELVRPKSKKVSRSSKNKKRGD